jgi:hypothetical protein
MVQREEQHRRQHHPADGRNRGQRGPAGVAKLADDQLAFDLQAHHEEEHRHQAVVDPVLKVFADLQAAGADRQGGMPQVVVGIRKRAVGPHQRDHRGAEQHQPTARLGLEELAQRAQDASDRLLAGDAHHRPRHVDAQQQGSAIAASSSVWIRAGAGPQRSRGLRGHQTIRLYGAQRGPSSLRSDEPGPARSSLRRRVTGGWGRRAGRGRRTRCLPGRRAPPRGPGPGPRRRGGLPDRSAAPPRHRASRRSAGRPGAGGS